MAKSRGRKSQKKKAVHNKLMGRHTKLREGKPSPEQAAMIAEINASMIERKKQSALEKAADRIAEQDEVHPEGESDEIPTSTVSDVMLLKDVVPTKYSQAFLESKAVDLAHEVVATQTTNAQSIWPDKHKSIQVVWSLENGKSMGLNVRGDKASFPITTKELLAEA